MPDRQPFAHRKWDQLFIKNGLFPARPDVTIGHNYFIEHHLLGTPRHTWMAENYRRIDRNFVTPPPFFNNHGRHGAAVTFAPSSTSPVIAP
jgi:hypothetical protein